MPIVEAHFVGAVNSLNQRKQRRIAGDCSFQRPFARVLSTSGTIDNDWPLTIDRS
jgi:hypothetical protein